MEFIPFIIILTVFISSVEFSVITDFKNSLLSFLKSSFDIDNNGHVLELYKKDRYNDRNYGKDGNTKIRKNKRIPSDSDSNVFASNDRFRLTKARDPPIGKSPVLDSLRQISPDYRRMESSDDSSSLELKEWKKHWKEHWLHKKFEAVNSSQPVGHYVNMAAARPWGVPCGDPNQHDMPWGTCMIAMECEAEYRIYRGDYFCGRTHFVCCSIQLNTYDMYEGFDVSLSASSLGTDSEEKKNRGKGSASKRKKNKEQRKKDRQKRKKKIASDIKKIINEIRKILTRTARNGTSSRKKKTKQLKRFIQQLKKQYLKDRQSVKDIHASEMIRIDDDLMKRLLELQKVNENFIRNSTFRDIVVNGTISRAGVRMLLEAYPDLASYFTKRRSEQKNYYNDYLNYDIEYGLIYY